jgi:ectoine hydroxylase-related dioxygenase (phytanoyl-CoA dioxygenase family)
VRIKAPEYLLNQKFQRENTMFSATEWHQDQGVATVEVDHTEMLTVWFPVSTQPSRMAACASSRNATRAACCIARAGPGQVFDLKIPEVIRQWNGIPVEMKRGTALFMHRLTMHSSLRNLSNAVSGASICANNRSGSPLGA